MLWRRSAVTAAVEPTWIHTPRHARRLVFTAVLFSHLGSFGICLARTYAACSVALVAFCLACKQRLPGLVSLPRASQCCSVGLVCHMLRVSCHVSGFCLSLSSWVLGAGVSVGEGLLLTTCCSTLALTLTTHASSKLNKLAQSSLISALDVRPACWTSLHSRRTPTAHPKMPAWS
jgi:hypothetical protein